jgi:hypothetical protein
MAAKVFISYRRDDSAGHAGRVHDWLAHEFGANLLFMDVDSIPLGSDFIKVLPPASSPAGTVSSNALAVLRLMISSNFVGAVSV